MTMAQDGSTPPAAMWLPPSTAPWPIDPAGFHADRLADAVAFAAGHETPWQRDIRAQLEAGNFEPPPDNEILGPVAPRGAPNGLILRHGRLAARWGDTSQVDMTFSVAKSYLSLLAGIAVADGLIGDLDAPVAEGPEFAGTHNGAITWRHLLQQTSEWEGTLFGKEDRIDRYRSLASEFAGRSAHRKGDPRPLQTPGTYWEYNDVRVNALSLALLRRFGRPLPEVFAERLLGPVGGSADWRWEGYSTSWITLNGRPVQSVSGGGHWGGGVFIHAEDQARIGQLMLQDGNWNGQRILPEGWVALSATPCTIKPDYGLLWWLNPGGVYKPNASHASYFAIGAGGNVTWIDPDHDLVAVLRWIDMAALDRWIGLVMAALA
jgi:CubicO group peptidase (beta-lactamase class C family)